MADYENPRGKQTVVIAIIFTILGNLIVMFRLITRQTIVKSIGFEDWCIAVAMLLSTAFTVLIKVQEREGLGRHVWDLDGIDQTNSFQALYASIIIYFLSLAFIKISILIQYYRIFKTSHMRKALSIVGLIIIAYSIETVFTTVFLCSPISKFWHPSSPGKCLKRIILWLVNAGIHIATDFTLIVLPMPVLKQLNLPRRQKRAVIFVFAIGGFACITSILRLKSLVEIARSGDFTYTNADAAAWSTVEINVGLICACLPVLRPVVARFLPCLFVSTGSKNISSFNDASPGRALELRERFLGLGRGGQATLKTNQSYLGVVGGSGNNLPPAPVRSESRIEGGEEDGIMVEECEVPENGQIRVVTVVQQHVEMRTSDDMVSRPDLEKGLMEDRRSVAEVSDGESQRQLV